MPTPPGVTGRVVSSRTKAKAASEVCQDTWACDRPTARRHTSKTSHKVSWLAAVVAVIHQPRAAIRPAARLRKPGSVAVAAQAGGRRRSRGTMADRKGGG